jgi:CHAD domain-containing protein
VKRCRECSTESQTAFTTRVSPRAASAEYYRSSAPRIVADISKICSQDSDASVNRSAVFATPMSALLASLEARIPHAAPSLVALRQQREHERHCLVRKLIKRLGRLEAVKLIEMLDEYRPALRMSFALDVRDAGTWRRTLRETLHERAHRAAEAIDHATGVYFPRRAHAARIAVKKLRYAMEIANQTRVADRSDAIRTLKKAQEVLGDRHDRQDLLERSRVAS